MKKIVTIGGGTGQYSLLQGLKNYDVDITAIVNVVDNGGSSGRLRTAFGVLPPGDIRNCLIALTDDSVTKEMADLFAYRFKSQDENGLNHNLGNLILTSLCAKYGDMGKAAKVAGQLLGIKGRVLPVSLDNVNLCAETHSGKILKGEENITTCKKEDRIKKIWLEPDAYIYGDAGRAIREADLVVVCAGEIYGSIIPHFLVKGVKEAIEQSKKIVCVCNLVTKQGTYGFRAGDFVSEIEKYLGKKFDYIICNTKQPTQKVVDKYVAEESFFVECDLKGDNIIKEPLLTEFVVGDLITARHDPKKTAQLIMNLLK